MNQLPNFATFVIDTLRELKLEAKYLELELNENIIINDDDKHTIDTIKVLSNAGIQIALDDFGSGYSNISYLNKIPVNRIKIDKSYIDNINTNPNDAAMVKAIIDVAARLGMQVLAEGVESLIQLQLLTNIKGVESQGNYLSVPLPSDEMEKLLVKMGSNEI